MIYADFNFRLFEPVATSETVSPLSLTAPTPGYPCPHKEARLQTLQNAPGTSLIASAVASNGYRVERTSLRAGVARGESPVSSTADCKGCLQQYPQLRILNPE